MFLFNLSTAEFLTLFSVASAVVFTLYLLDRSRRQIKVATLRFWTAAEKPVESTRRRRITQWPSLLLQLLSIALLLLALSQLRIGSPDTSSRDHVLLLDTSSWMGATEDRVPLLTQAKTQALAYVKAIPAADRLMVIHADSVATPVTGFETDRRKIEAAIRSAKPSGAALDMRQALDAARRVQNRAAKRGGEIVFAGAGRMPRQDGAELDIPRNLRVLAVQAQPENTGIRKIGMRRSASEADLWHIFVSLRNYGRVMRTVDLAIQFGGAPIGSRSLRIAAGTEQEAAFEFRTRAAGIVEARIRSAGDSFAGDDRAVLEIPDQPAVAVTVCGAEPGLLKPLFDANAAVQASYKPAAQCQTPPQEGIVVYDRFLPSTLAKRAVLIDPPSQGSPVPLSPAPASVTLDRWVAGHPLGAGLRTHDFRIDAARVFTPGKDDVRVAESSAGPVIVARPGLVAFGFHPMRSALRFELATPLLFANILRWLAPEGFHASEVYASPVGSVSVTLDAEPDGQPVEVSEDGVALPYSLGGKMLRFYSSKPGTVRVRAGGREQIHSLTLPDVPDAVWEIPAGARRGVPRARDLGSSSRDIWYWLALLGGIGLLAEWLLFSPTGRRVATQVSSKASFLAAAALAMASVLGAQTAAPGFDTILARELEADLHFLASDAMRGRLTGTAENLMSALWVESRFKRMGLAPVGGSSLQQRFNLTWAELAKGNRLVGRSGGAANKPAVLDGFMPLFFAPDARATGRVTFAGFGISAPDLRWNDFGAAVSGRVVLLLEGEPGANDPKSIFDGVVTSVHADPMRKAIHAQSLGAIAVLFVDPGQRGGASSRFANTARSYWPTTPPHLKRYAITSWAEELKIPVASVSPAFASYLLRQHDLKKLAREAEKGGAAPVALDSEVEVETRVTRHVIDDLNIVGMIPGADPNLKDEAVIVSAHYDHNGAEGSQIYNGADDNGSGTVALIEIAEAYAAASARGQKPKRTVIFAAWGSEERCCGPLLGAWAWIRNPSWPMEKTVAVLNMDMIGRSEEVPDGGGGRFRGLPLQTAASNAHAVNVIGTSYSSDMRSAVMEANRPVDMTLRFRYDNNASNLLRRSDHWVFLQNGVPSLWFHTGLHPDYHTAFDRPEKIDYAKMERVARLVHQMSWNLANAAGRPAMIKPRPVPPPD